MDFIVDWRMDRLLSMRVESFQSLLGLARNVKVHGKDIFAGAL
jgi:hypothetical protein